MTRTRRLLTLALLCVSGWALAQPVAPIRERAAFGPEFFENTDAAMRNVAHPDDGEDGGDAEKDFPEHADNREQQ